MKKNLIILIILFCLTSLNVFGQKNNNAIKVNAEINTLFKGDGFSFSSLGYERFLDNRHSIGFWIGGRLKTSKFELANEVITSSITNYILVLDYYYYLYKQNNSGIYFTPAVFYESTSLITDDDRSRAVGLNLGIGFRQIFDRIIIDCLLLSSLAYQKQKNDIYTYRSKEVKPIDMKISIGYVF
jgi:hypothetical protein